MQPSQPSQPSQRLVISLDAGTQSSRCIILDMAGQVVAQAQKSNTLLTPNPGWAELDPMETISTAKFCLEKAVSIAKANSKYQNAAFTIGITNHRESTIAWDPITGKPFCNMILWMDTRTSSVVEKLTADYQKQNFRSINGLPISTYFSASKMHWMIHNIPEIKAKLAIHTESKPTVYFGTVDTWLVWNMTNGAAFVSDCTNASRTMLMDLKSLAYSPPLVNFFGLKISCLPQICSSAQIYSKVDSSFSTILESIPISAILGDQQAALVGHFSKDGECKVTYGTGCFLLASTGTKPNIIPDNNKLLTTVGFKLGVKSPPTYALEGAIPVAGSGISWVQKIFKFSSPKEISTLAQEAWEKFPQNPSHQVNFYSTFGEMSFCGMSDGTTRQDMAFAVVSSFCFEVVEFIRLLSNSVKITRLKVDGGITKSKIMLEIQSNLAQCPLYVPTMVERTAYGAAIAAVIGNNWFKSIEDVETAFGYDSKVVTPGKRDCSGMISFRQAQKAKHGF